MDRGAVGYSPWGRRVGQDWGDLACTYAGTGQFLPMWIIYGRQWWGTGLLYLFIPLCSIMPTIQGKWKHFSLRVRSEKWSTSSHVNKQRCHSRQWFQFSRATRKENNACDQAAATPYGETQETGPRQLRCIWGTISVSPDFCLFSHIENHWIP